MGKVRCPACRGSKKVAKLGGMIGECNTCSGSGQINASDKPVPVIAMEQPAVDNVIKAVANSVPATTLELKDVPTHSHVEHKATINTLPVTPDTKIDPKRALYKRKKS